MLIGINQYAAPTLPTLKYAEKDARELGKLLQEICGFQVRCLLGQEAGFDQFQWVVEQKRLSPELPVFRAHDRFLLFFAGHGELYQGDYHLHLYHPSPHPAPSSLHLDALSNHLRHSIPCTQCMTILDACRSIAQPGMRGPSLVSSLRSRDVKTMSTSYQGKTIKTLFGCKEKGVSWEDDRYQHGVLTYHLKQALEKLRAKPAFTFEELVDQASDLMRAWGHWDNPAFRQEPYFYHVSSLERILLRG